MATPTAPLPTRAEFGRQLSADRRRTYWAIGLCCASLLLLFAAMPFKGERMNRAGIPPGAAERFTGSDALQGLIPFGILIGGIWWADRQSQTKCPACRQSLFSAHDPYIAMVTGRCPKCAAPMFADDEHDFDAQQTNRRSPPTAREALRDVREQLRTYRPWIPWAIAGAVLVGLGLKAKSLLETPQYASLLGEVWTEFLKPLTIAPGVLVGSLGMWACVRALQNSAESCPACSATINGWSRNTGNCTSCGLPVIDDPFPGVQPRSAAATVRGSVSEFAQIAKQRRGLLPMGCFIGAGIGLIWFTPLLVYSSQQPRYHQPSAWEMAAFVVMLAGYVLFQCLGVWWWQRRLSRDLRCPECERDLLYYAPLVISSQRCCHCGCQVLEPPVSRITA